MHHLYFAVSAKKNERKLRFQKEFGHKPNIIQQQFAYKQHFFAKKKVFILLFYVKNRNKRCDFRNNFRKNIYNTEIVLNKVTFFIIGTWYIDLFCYFFVKKHNKSWNTCEKLLRNPTKYSDSCLTMYRCLCEVHCLHFTVQSYKKKSNRWHSRENVS